MERLFFKALELLNPSTNSYAESENEISIDSPWLIFQQIKTFRPHVDTFAFLSSISILYISIFHSTVTCHLYIYV